MMDKELKLNASGYYDEPCYKAITASPKAGEIWVHNQSGAYMLVIANVNGVCPTLRLNEQEKEGCIPVTCRDIMYTNPAFMGYVFETNLSQYVKTVKEEEFKTVKQRIADVLGINVAVSILDVDQGTHPHILEEKVKGLEVERNELLAERKALKEKLKEKTDGCDVVLGELNATCMELEKAMVYKDMYNTLMDKMIALAVKRGEA